MPRRPRPTLSLQLRMPSPLARTSLQLFRCEPGGGFVSMSNDIQHRTVLQERPLVIETTSHATPTRVGDIAFEVVGAMQVSAAAVACGTRQSCLRLLLSCARAARACELRLTPSFPALAQYERMQELRRLRPTEDQSKQHALMQAAHEEEELNDHQYQRQLGSPVSFGEVGPATRTVSRKHDHA